MDLALIKIIKMEEGSNKNTRSVSTESRDGLESLTGLNFNSELP